VLVDRFELAEHRAALERIAAAVRAGGAR